MFLDDKDILSNGRHDVIRTVYDQESATNSDPDFVQAVIKEPVKVKSSSEDPVVVTFPDNSDPLDVNIKNSLLPVHIDGELTITCIWY
jgi:hypothetical protein